MSCGVRKRPRMTRCTSICGRITSSRPDAHAAAEPVAASPLLPHDAGGPVFAEPWQAQAFAMAVQLSVAGHFTWTEWTTALGEQLQAVAARGEPDDGSRYFEHWLAALE